MSSARHNWFVDFLIGAWSIPKGMAVTLLNWVGRARVTENYPAKAPQLYPRFRGRMVHKRDAAGRQKCTACLACQKACPTAAIPLIVGDANKGREKRAASYVWDGARCFFCNLCVEACPFDAIALGPNYSTVGESRADTHRTLEQMLEPATGPAGAGTRPAEVSN